MVRTKKKRNKKRNYKKAPRNTRVFRCVQKVKKKHKIGDAIAICQSSTKQSYRNGRSLKGGGGSSSKKTNKPYEPDDIVIVKKRFESLVRPFLEFKIDERWKIKTILQTTRGCIASLQKCGDNILTHLLWSQLKDPTNFVKEEGNIYCNEGVIKQYDYTYDSEDNPFKYSDLKKEDGGTGILGGRRKKKTRKKRGGCWPNCFKKKSSNPNSGEFAKTKPPQEEEMRLIDSGQQVRRRQIHRIPSEDSLKLGSEKIKEWHRSRSTSPTMDPGTAAHHNLPKDHFADVDAILKKAAQKGLGGGRRKKKTRKKRGGEKSKRVKNFIKIFQQYPEIFPSGYFRFLGARLQNHIDKKTLWYKNGVILTWIKYQKTVKKTPKCIIKPGDIKLDQIVNKNQGNGAAKKVVLQFLKKFEKNRIWLEVRANNKRAIKFYKKNGFKNICKIKFGDIPGIMMVKK